MADAWQSAWVEVVPDFKNFRSKANGEMTGILGTAGDNGGRESSKRFNGAFLGGMGGLVAGLAAFGLGRLIGDAISTGVDFAMDGIKSAAAMAETKSAIGEVFGKDSAKLIEKWAGRGAKVLGQSEGAALGAAQTFGVYGKAAGLAGRDLATFSTDLAGLGTDLASFFGGSTEDAIAAIGSGLRGEAEPLRQYGILLDDAALKAEAMAMGIYDGKGALTQEEKILAARSAIFSQSADAQGDFERTSGSLANQQKILADSFEDSKARLGEALMPAMTELMTLANDHLVPILDDLIEEVGPVLADALEQSAPLFEDLLLAVAPLIPDLVRLAVEALPVVVGAIEALAPLVQAMITGWGDFWSIIEPIFGFLSGNTSLQELADAMVGLKGPFGDLSRVANDVRNNIFQFVRDAVGAFGRFLSGVRTNIDNAIGVVRALPGRIRGFFAGIGSWLYNSGRSLLQGFVNGIRSMIGAVGNAIGGVLDFAAGFFPHSPAERGPFSGAGWRAIREAGGAIMDQFQSGLSPVGVPLSVASMTARVLPAAFGGAGTPGVGVVINGGLTVQNPLAEPASRSVPSGLRQMDIELGMA